MTNHSDIGDLADLLAETGQRHHEAFVEVGGEDPEWPMWYAEYMLEPITRILDTAPTRSKLVQCLLNAEEAYASSPSHRPWPEFYAGYLLGLGEDLEHSPPEPG